MKTNHHKKESIMPVRSALVIIALCALLGVLTGCGPNNDPLQNMYPNAFEYGNQQYPRYGGRAVAICRHPTNNKEMIVASESGGLFKTTDHGADWAQISGTTTFWFTDVKYFPANASIIFATANGDTKAVSGGGIWRSTDAGNSWTHVILPPAAYAQTDNFGAYCIDVDPSSNRVWAGTSGGLVYSDDQGVSWAWCVSTKSGTPDYNPGVLSVVVPVANHVKIVTAQGVSVSDDNGISWTTSSLPLPTSDYATIGFKTGLYNQISCSPFNDKHLFLSIKNAVNCSLFFSRDNGKNWTMIRQDDAEWRNAFVKVVPSLTGVPTQIDVYYSNGGASVFAKATFTDGADLSVVQTWADLDVSKAHTDVTDMTFETDGKTPLAMTSDGGVALTNDKGASWQMAGSGSNGYSALQVNDLTGQNVGGHSNLYFTTQDNGTFASADDGASWPYFFFSEGSIIQVPPDKTIGNGRIVYVNADFYGQWLLKSLFSAGDYFPLYHTNPYGVPFLIRPGVYAQSSADFDDMTTQVNLTTDTGVNWIKRATFPQNFTIDAAYKSSGGPFSPVLYVSANSDGTGNLNRIERTDNILGSGSAVVSDILGFGYIGSFRRKLADDKIFAIDPGDPDFIIVPNIKDNLVKKSWDGGQTWKADTPLTKLVTNNGEFSFSFNSVTSEAFEPGAGNSQITKISFDPYVKGRIIVGTMQAGIFLSCDYGQSWSKIDETDQIPEVSGFYFYSNNTVVISSYGRGLWKLQMPVCNNYVKIPPIEGLPPYTASPIFYHNGVSYPVSQLENINECQACGFYLINGGDITGLKINKDNNTVGDVTVTSGTINGYGPGNFKMSVPFKLARANHKYNANGDTLLTELLKVNNNKIKGLYLEGSILKGWIISNKDVALAQLPKPQTPRSQLLVEKILSGSRYTIKIHGSGFNPQSPLAFLVDGVKLTAAEKPAFNKKGNFSQAVNLPFSTGDHTVMVKQLANGKQNMAATTFFIPFAGDDEEKIKSQAKQKR